MMTIVQIKYIYETKYATLMEKVERLIVDH